MSFLIRSAPSQANANADRESFDETIPEHHKSGLPGEVDPEPLPASSSSVIKFYPEWCTCIGGATLEYPKGENATCGGLIKYLCQCPPFGPVARIAVFLTVFALTWLVLFFLIGEVAGLHGPIFAVILLEIVGLFAGISMKSIGLPALLAPLVLGIILRNVDAIDIFEYFKYPYNKEYCSYLNNTLVHPRNNSIDLSKCCQKFGTQASSLWITPIREIALTLILTRAGTELSPKQLRKLKGVVPALAFVPCITEGIVSAALFYGFFYKLDPSPFLCLVGGFSLAAVSPAVVVPGMLTLARKGYGVLQGVPTLLIAASSIDDVLAISLYTISLSLAIKRDSETLKCNSPFVTHHEESVQVRWLEIAGGPLGIVIGVIYGIIVGCILHFLPSRDTKRKGNQRLVLLLCCNLVCTLGFSKTEFLAGAGSLGVLTTSFVASFGWRSQPHWKPAMHTVEHKLTLLWTLFVPILFGTIGKEMRFIQDKKDSYLTEKDISTLKTLGEHHPFDAVNIARIIGLILISLVARCGVTFFLVGFAGLNKKERLFVALAWIPKATVQAALAPLVLSTVVERGVTDPKVKVMAMNIVVAAVFAILLTAPVGAILIALTGPKLLQKVRPEEIHNIIEEEFPNGEADPYEDNEFSGRRGSRATTASVSERSFGLGEQPINESFMNVDTTPSQLIARGTGAGGSGSDILASSGSDIGRGAGSSTGVGSKGDTGLPRDIP